MTSVTYFVGLQLSILLVLCGGCTRTHSKTLGRIGVKGNWMVDQDGRVRIFHGFNAVTKGFPWYPDYLLNDTRLELYKSWGFNAVRLGTMWTGAMPKKDYINETYIDIMTDIVKKLEKHGMYALLDMHQDVLSTKYGAYDGAPRWLIDSLPPSPHPYPWPLKSISQWSEGYLAEATGRGFQGIYSNISHAQDYYIQFWEKITSTFKDSTSVLGYELINEPWAGDIYSHPTLILPGEAGSSNLLPMYDNVNKAIRKIDNTTLIFYEPVTWGVVFNGKVIGSGFTRVPGGDTYRDRSVFSYHYYCWFLDFIDGSLHDWISRKICDKVLGPKVFDSATSDVRQTGGGSFLTEFGECSTEGPSNSTSTIECEFVMSEADKRLQSWTYWDSGFFDQDGNVNWKDVQGFARAYVRAVAGIPVSMDFQPNSKSFSLSYNLNTGIQEPTEIVVPELQYPRRFNVTVTPTSMKWTYDKSEGIVNVTPKGSHVPNGQLVNVNISAK